ncbi:SIMPL domain-containing protein [Haloterrigena sp. SYSU A558-1]|uniref:SIMPL domain-containing protein n=1 Tax=Haloterrigena gelatinilytica TaxID=2741724 RepID=A0ABX2LCY6_9EURY|nr:SIMPL domain-containing protein [Haloterrigena gelatinilytica]NUC73265.1 SIMPL domain-containing protein [Haloterrigena gelatinilytica]
MNRRQFLAVSSVGLAAAIAGCVGDVRSDADGEAPTESTTDERERADRGEIAVTASGDVEAEPDRAVVTAGVQASGESADAVTDELATGADDLRETFADLGIPPEDVEEGQYRVHPERERDAEGFEGAHSFEVTITDVDRVGEVIDVAIEAGADDVGRVNFALQAETRATLRRDAIDAALATADEEAAHVADNRNVDLEGTTAVTTADVRVRPVEGHLASGDAAAEAAPPTEIEADPVSVSASVTVTYAFVE